MLNEQSEKSERNVSHDLEMDRAMVAHAQALNSIDIHHLPKGIKFLVSIDPINNLFEPRIVPRWNPDQDSLRSAPRFLNSLAGPHSRLKLIAIGARGLRRFIAVHVSRVTSRF
jgi:hypothetical protein